MIANNVNCSVKNENMTFVDLTKFENDFACQYDVPALRVAFAITHCFVELTTLPLTDLAD